MKRIIRVHLGDRRDAIGELRHDRQGRRESAAFSYDPGWLSDRDRFAIDPSLPLVTGFQFHAHGDGASLFHGAIADTEPDGWGRRVILRDHARRRGTGQPTISTDGGSLLPAPPPPLGELDFLLAVDDESRVGALRFKDESGVFRGYFSSDGGGTPPLLALPQLLSASRAVETSTETARDLAYLLGRGTSLGGMRPKCSLRDEDGQLAICKFPSVADERAVTRGEVLALTLARRAGIGAAQARIVMSDDIPVAVIRRFDRTTDGRRIPYISASTMLAVDRDNPGEVAYTDIVDAIRICGYQVKADIEELFRRIAFSIRINNVDDHLHNHGFLHVHHGQWRLAPAFDVNPFPGRLRELKTWISHNTGPDSSLEALLSEAAVFGLSPARAGSIVDEVVSVVRTWRQVGSELGMTAMELDAYADAFR